MADLNTLPHDSIIRPPRKIKHSKTEYEYHGCDCFYVVVHLDDEPGQPWRVECESLNMAVKKKDWHRYAFTLAEAEEMIYRDHDRNVRRWLTKAKKATSKDGE